LLQVETLLGFDKNSYKQVVFSNILDCHRNTQKAKKIGLNMINIMNL